MTQAQRILRELKKGRRLTPLLALNEIGCLSLSQRIGDLKRKGYQIARTMIEVGPRKHVASYRLIRGAR
jgi:hypothetical protein